MNLRVWFADAWQELRALVTTIWLTLVMLAVATWRSIRGERTL